MHLATLLPLDKRKNADGRRRALRVAAAQEPEPQGGIAPRLRELMAEYSATGLPPVYLTQDDPYDQEKESEP